MNVERLTARTHDGHAYLANVKDDEQEVECRSRNTAQCIMDSWERLAAYEDTGLSPADIPALTARAEAAEARADAAVEDLKRFSACCQCNANIDGSCCDMFDGTAENKYFCSNWQWRGPQEAGKGEAE